MQETNREQRPERALLVEVDTGEYDAEASLAELYELTRSAGAEPFGAVTQKRPAPDAASCVGSGMLEEIASHCKAHEIDLLIFDCELSPTQIRNVEDACGVRVVDRTMLILDIFAARARSREGKLQVELAQLRYLLPRLSGAGKDLSRLGGGIGTRGPGETKLETDRRHIRRRIATLREQLAVVERHRSLIRTRREKDGVMTVALVGYTNAGKSTLMNRLTEAGVLAEDMLFATLDPTSRALRLPNGQTVMLIDTVGLVRRLPHQLVQAFHSTLEQAAEFFADLTGSTDVEPSHKLVNNDTLDSSFPSEVKTALDEMEAGEARSIEVTILSKGVLLLQKNDITADTDDFLADENNRDTLLTSLKADEFNGELDAAVDAFEGVTFNDAALSGYHASEFYTAP